MIYINTEDVETRFDTSKYKLQFNSIDRPSLEGKNNKVIGLTKDNLGGKIMTNFAGLRVKTYSYLLNGSSEDKKAKVTKHCVIKRTLNFENYKNSLEATQPENKINYMEKNKIDIDRTKENILKIQQRFKSERHSIFTEEIDKIAKFQMMIK